MQDMAEGGFGWEGESVLKEEGILTLNQYTRDHNGVRDISQHISHWLGSRTANRGQLGFLTLINLVLC